MEVNKDLQQILLTYVYENLARQLQQLFTRDIFMVNFVVVS